MLRALRPILMLPLLCVASTSWSSEPTSSDIAQQYEPFVQALLQSALAAATTPAGDAGRVAERSTGPADAEALIPKAQQVPAVLRMKRVSSGPDGKSRLDVVELPIVNHEPGSAIQSRLYATDVELGYGAPGRFIDWHAVSTPRLWIILQGAWEFGTGDGKVHRLEAGDIVLAADTTGQGHTSRNVGNVPSFVLTVRLPAENSLAPKPNPPRAR